MKKTYGVLAVLVLALLVGLLLAAGPAVADNFPGTPPGSEWSGHDINGRAIITWMEEFPIPDDPEPGEYIVFNMISNDPLVTGEMEAWITWGTTDAEGWHGGGNWIVTPAIGGGTWAGDFEAVTGSGAFTGKPYQHLVFASELLGTGTNPLIDGQHLWLAMHAGWGNPWIFKGWIED